jgi:DNA-binding beta-propeller fold protein YncE
MFARRAVLALLFPVAASAQYRVVKEIHIGGPTRFDYLAVDTANHRLYVSHGTETVVVDVDRDTVFGVIKNTPGVHGAAFAPELNRGFTSNGADTTVTIFNLKTLAEIARVKVTGGRNPDAIYYDPTTKRVYTMNATGSTTAIDAATGAVVGSLQLGGKPETAVGDGTGAVFVNIEDKNEIVKFDGRTLKELARWSIKPCDEPTGLAIDVRNNRLFAGCSDTSVVVDAKTGKVVATIPVGKGVDAAAMDVSAHLLFAPGGQDSSMTIIRQNGPDSYAVVGKITTRRGSRTMALDPRTHRIYVAFGRYGPPAVPDTGGRGGRGRGPVAIADSFSVLVLEPGR